MVISPLFSWNYNLITGRGPTLLHGSSKKLQGPWTERQVEDPNCEPLWCPKRKTQKGRKLSHESVIRCLQKRCKKHFTDLCQWEFVINKKKSRFCTFPGLACFRDGTSWNIWNNDNDIISSSRIVRWSWILPPLSMPHSLCLHLPYRSQLRSARSV